ncbi:hypothetical protein ACN4EG_15960 [Alkalinema pantanalense CENA528]
MLQHRVWVWQVSLATLGNGWGTAGVGGAGLGQQQKNLRSE